MKLGLVLTNDWELFGDGSGDYFEIQHKPTLELLDVLDSYKAKITLMAEVEQQFYHKSIAGTEPLAKKITEAWEELVTKAVIMGNDVQLHLHPQWIDSRYHDGKWHLNMDNWAISSLAYDLVNLEIQRGKAYLENLIKPVDSNYSCIGFRAGAYCIQPPVNVIKALRDNNIYCDTSVTKSMASEGFYDFHKASSHIVPWFTKADDVCCCGSREEGILEMPIYGEPGYEFPALKKFMPRLYYFLKFGLNVAREELEWQKEKEHIKDKRYPRSARFYKTKARKDFRWYMNALVNKSAVQLDYDHLPASAFVKSLKNILNDRKLKRNYDGMILPVVASGHIKDIHNCGNIRSILDQVGRELKDEVEYWTLTDAYKYWHNVEQ